MSERALMLGFYSAGVSMTGTLLFASYALGFRNGFQHAQRHHLEAFSERLQEAVNGGS